MYLCNSAFLWIFPRISTHLHITLLKHAIYAQICCICWYMPMNVYIYALRYLLNSGCWLKCGEKIQVRVRVGVCNDLSTSFYFCIFPPISTFLPISTYFLTFPHILSLSTHYHTSLHISLLKYVDATINVPNYPLIRLNMLIYAYAYKWINMH